MIEGIHPQARVVRAGQKCVARAEARSQHAEVLIALLFEPVQAAANIDHRLPARRNRAPNVGADRVVGALQLHRPADVVIGLREPQRRNPHAVEQPAQHIVAEPIRVPLRQHHDRLLGPRRVFVRRGRIPARVHQIVFRVRRPLRRGKPQILRLRELTFGCLLANRCVLGQRLRPHVGRKQLGIALFQPEVRRPRIAKELAAMPDEDLVDARHRGFSRRIVSLNLRAGHGRA